MIEETLICFILSPAQTRYYKIITATILVSVTLDTQCTILPNREAHLLGDRNGFQIAGIEILYLGMLV